jgi:hypothetical protein
MDREEYIYQLVCGILLVVSLIGIACYLIFK